MQAPNWTSDLKKYIYDSVKRIPEECSLSFSGGVDSSMILFTMIDLGRPPKELITFEIEGEATPDIIYAKRISSHYNLPLKIAVIPNNITKQKLLEEVESIIRSVGSSRNIETQVNHAYLHMRPLISTPNLVTGFYEDIMFFESAYTSSRFLKSVKGEIPKEEFDAEYREIRSCVYQDKYLSGTEHNYPVIIRYLNSLGLNVFCPYKDEKIFNLFQGLGFKETNFNPFTGKKQRKWFITECTHKCFFDVHGNGKNINNMQTTGENGGLKGLHRRVLLQGTSHKDTRAVYNKILKDINPPKDYFF